MKVLVTGATGFLGKYILDELSKYDYEIIAFGRNMQRGKELEQGRIKFQQGDFCKEEDIFLATQGIDAIIHAGALSSVWGEWESFYKTNVLGTENILKVCRHRNIKKLVYISSPSIYAGAKDQLFLKEEDAPKTNNLNFYIKSKILAEKKIQEYSDIPTVILRPRALFGIGDTSIIPRLLELNKKKGIPLFCNGTQQVDITCVENVALAIRLSLEKEKAVGNVYNITNGESMAFRDILDLFFKEMGISGHYKNLPYPLVLVFVSCLEIFYKILHIKKEPILTKYTLYLLRYSQTLSIEKAKQDLEYKPILTLYEGIQKYVNFYQKH